jgi:hypothetical protein
VGGYQLFSSLLNRTKPRCLGSRISEKFLGQFSHVEGIFNYYYSFLQDSAMKLVHAERNGEAFDSQLVIGKNYFEITVHKAFKESIKAPTTHSCVVSVQEFCPFL